MPYICPITRFPPKVPVITNAGITYDFVAIATNLLNLKPHDPCVPSIIINSLTYNYALADTDIEQNLITEKKPRWEEGELEEIAFLYTRLTQIYPNLYIHGIQNIEGVGALIQGIPNREAMSTLAHTQNNVSESQRFFYGSPASFDGENRISANIASAQTLAHTQINARFFYGSPASLDDGYRYTNNNDFDY